MKPYHLLTLLLLALAAAPLAAEDESARYNFLVTFMGAKVGWTTFTYGETELDGKPAILETQQSYVSIAREHDSRQFEMRGTTQTWYAEDWRKLKRLDVLVSGPQTRRTEVAWADTISVAIAIDGGEPHRVELEPGDAAVYGKIQAWQKLLALGGETGAQIAFQSVDAESSALVQESWTLSGSTRQRLASGELAQGVEVRIVRAGRAAVAVFGNDKLPLYYRDASGFALERAAEIPSPFKPEPVAMRNLMRANVAVQQFRRLERMEVEFAYDHEADADLPPLVESNEYHEVRKLDNGYAVLLKARALPEGAEKLAFPLSEVDEGVERFLQATPMCQSDDEELAAVAARLTGDKETAVDAVRAIMSFVSSHLRPESGSTGSASAKQAYLERKGDCTEHAALFVALARAAGIPARNAGGLTYLVSRDEAIFGFHAWAEVWLGEWVPVDTTVEELGTSARYILLEYDEPGMTEGRGRFSRMLGQGINPVINTYKLRNRPAWQREEAEPHFD
jgi:hypothetical protein